MDFYGGNVVPSMGKQLPPQSVKINYENPIPTQHAKHNSPAVLRNIEHVYTFPRLGAVQTRCEKVERLINTAVRKKECGTTKNLIKVREARRIPNCFTFPQKVFQGNFMRNRKLSFSGKSFANSNTDNVSFQATNTDTAMDECKSKCTADRARATDTDTVGAGSPSLLTATGFVSLQTTTAGATTKG